VSARTSSATNENAGLVRPEEATAGAFEMVNADRGLPKRVREPHATPARQQRSGECPALRVRDAVEIGDA